MQTLNKDTGVEVNECWKRVATPLLTGLGCLKYEVIIPAEDSVSAGNVCIWSPLNTSVFYSVAWCTINKGAQKTSQVCSDN